jgi:hypothetical protein
MPRAHPHSVKSDPVPMDKRAKQTRPCSRCGLVREPSHHKETIRPDLCRDCKDADPWFVHVTETLDALGYPAWGRYAEDWGGPVLDDLGYPAWLGYCDEQVAA